MKLSLTVSFLFASLAFASAAFAAPASPAAKTPAPDAPAARPVKIIFDTDMGNDVDDALALAMIHGLQSRGVCELLAVTLTHPDPLAGAYVDAVNTFYGRGEIPIGVSPDAANAGPSKFLKLANERDASGAFVFPHDFDSSKAPLSLAVLRRTLAAAEDRSIVIVQVGFFSNLGALLTSQPDSNSPLSGMELITRKVRLLSIMAGAFQTANDSNHYCEYNVRYDVPAAQRLARTWPTPIVWSGWEIGVAIPFPAYAVDHDFSYAKRHPVAEAYQLHNPTPHERPTWDLTSVIAAVYPKRDFFKYSVAGSVTVQADGFTRFSPAKNKKGRDRFLSVSPEQASRLRGLFEGLCTEPPSKP